MRAMIPSVRLAVLLFVLCTACGDSTHDSGAAPTASRDVLIGTWKVDFDASLTRSRAAFLADASRGAATYPADPAEKERMVKEETKELLGPMRLTYMADGKTTWTIGGEAQEGTYEVLETNGPRMRIRSTAGRTHEMQIEFARRDEMHWTTRGKGAPTIILRRA